jgi:PAS domain S-box-containing protein
MNAVAVEKKSKTPDRQILEQIVALSSEGVLLIDARDACMPVVFVNPAYETLTGYAAEELVGSTWQMLNRDGVPALEELRAAFGKSEAIEIDLPDLRKDGTL